MLTYFQLNRINFKTQENESTFEYPLPINSRSHFYRTQSSFHHLDDSIESHNSSVRAKYLRFKTSGSTLAEWSIIVWIMRYFASEFRQIESIAMYASFLMKAMLTNELKFIPFKDTRFISIIILSKSIHSRIIFSVLKLMILIYSINIRCLPLLDLSLVRALA